jgi:beta-glucosidase
VRFDAGNDPKAAADLARSSDVAIVCIGNHPTCDAGWYQCPEPGEGKEAIDRQDIALAPAQVELVRRVIDSNPRTIVVLKSSFPYAINWIQQHAPAVLHLAHNSQEEGNALADALFGDFNPGGRLVQTWPRSLEQLPPMMDYDIRNGRTYMYFKGEPLYPFGFGLSYATFGYSNLTTSSEFVSAETPITVEIDVRNTSARAGDEVVQMYVRHLDSSVARPRQELRGFKRITLAPGESQTVEMSLTQESVSYWDDMKHRFVVEKGRIEIRVGGSSADIRARKTINVE